MYVCWTKPLWCTLRRFAPRRHTQISAMSVTQVETLNNFVLTCTLCRSVVPWSNGDLEADHALLLHQGSEICKRRRATKTYCSLKSCKVSETGSEGSGTIYLVDCPKCDKHFCLSHRFPDTHSCIGIVERIPNNEKKSCITSKIAHARTGTAGSRDAVRRGAKNGNTTATNLNFIIVKMRSRGPQGVLEANKLFVELCVEEELLSQYKTQGRTDRAKAGRTGRYNVRVEGGDTEDDPHYTVPWVLQEVWLDSTKTPPWNTDRLLEMFNTPSHRCSSVHLLKVNGEPASADISDTAVTLLDLRISLANLGVTQGGQLLMFRTLRK
eukprot:Lankesteria_metandrocarpae@DN1670_c0_g1_i3.p1